MAVMQPKENVYISTQIENITEFAFVCACVESVCAACPVHSWLKLFCLFYKTMFSLNYYINYTNLRQSNAHHLPSSGCYKFSR